MGQCWDTPEHRQGCGACRAGIARLCGIPLIDVDLGDSVAPYAERRAELVGVSCHCAALYVVRAERRPK